MPGLPVIRVYLDTSIFGGIHDQEFSEATNRLFAQIASGRFLPVVSVLVADEMTDAPERVQASYQSVLASAEALNVDEAALRLRNAYLRAGVVGARWSADALHVALATVAECAIIVSWNFKHIVSFRRIPLYNAVNRVNGYGEIGIFTPQEVIEDEDEDI
jgi:predicted nucleic acid-binding protein